MSEPSANEDNEPTADIVGEMRVVDYEPRWRDDFARLNLEWVERWFTVEPVDREVLGDPESSVLAAGGRILFAIDETDRALGTVALMRYPDGEVELTKMAVDPALRGGGIGRKLMIAALAAYEELGARRLFLESNTRLEAALKLYESVGFRYQTSLRPGSHVDRADVYMIWDPTVAE